MPVAKPKRQTTVALVIFLVLVFCSFFMLFHSLLTTETYFAVKLILAPIVLVIGLLVLGKFIASVKTVTFDKNRIDVDYHISGKKVRIAVKEILGWREETVGTKNGDFRELKILYGKKKVLKISNRENTSYEPAVKWLRNKVKVKKSS